MGDKPIIFSEPMVRALLDGRKTQTRRVLKPQPPEGFAEFCGFVGPIDEARIVFDCSPPVAPPHEMVLPVNIRDRLWVRERFKPAPMESAPDEPRPTQWNIAYAAGGQEIRVAPAGYNPMLYNYERWSPSIHMPRWASRITLLVTDVRVQRVQEISEADARAGGCSEGSVRDDVSGVLEGWSAKTSFRTLWNDIHGADAWDANPWVAAYTFEVEKDRRDG